AASSRTGRRRPCRCPAGRGVGVNGDLLGEVLAGGQRPEVCRLVTRLDCGLTLGIGEEQRIIWFALLEMRLVHQLPAQPLNYWLNPSVLQVLLVPVLRKQVLLFLPEFRE